MALNRRPERERQLAEEGSRPHEREAATPLLSASKTRPEEAREVLARHQAQPKAARSILTDWKIAQCHRMRLTVQCPTAKG
jgi:hypothetical protein